MEFRPVDYDHEALALEMEREAMPPEFVETIRTGWWTTCLENVPARERAAQRMSAMRVTDRSRAVESRTR